MARKLALMLFVSGGDAAALRELIEASLDAVSQSLHHHTYYGRSVIPDPTGEIVVQAGTEEEGLIVECNLDVIVERRRVWQFYRDRRPDSCTKSAPDPSLHSRSGVNIERRLTQSGACLGYVSGPARGFCGTGAFSANPRARRHAPATKPIRATKKYPPSSMKRPSRTSPVSSEFISTRRSEREKAA